MHLDLEDMRDGYVRLGRTIMDHGEHAAPRGEPTAEILGASFTLHNPYDALPVGVGRGVVKALAVTEALQAIGGITDPRRLIEVAPHFAKFTDEHGELRGAYGPRLRTQIPLAIERLERDPDSRQALVAIWQPALDSVMGLHDYPCTISLQWAIRRGRLVAFTHMRSNDFWLGVPYDVFMFTRLQITIAEVLSIPVGPYHHAANSLHIYERDFDKVKALANDDSIQSQAMGSVSGATWDQAVERACAIHGRYVVPDQTWSEDWMADAIRPKQPQ